MSANRHSKGRARWLLARENGVARTETGREWKRARQEGPTGAEAIAARRPYGRALDILKEQEDSRLLGAAGALSGSHTHCAEGRSGTITALLGKETRRTGVRMHR